MCKYTCLHRYTYTHNVHICSHTYRYTKAHVYTHIYKHIDRHTGSCADTHIETLTTCLTYFLVTLLKHPDTSNLQERVTLAPSYRQADSIMAGGREGMVARAGSWLVIFYLHLGSTD